MKGIVLAGGSGTRLYPLTKSISKQLLPIYDKPMIYYSLSVLMLAGIQDILIISTPKDISRFEDIFGDGNEFGINITYKIQNEPKGIAEAFILGEEFIENDSVTLILGDNIFYGQGFTPLLRNVMGQEGATVFGYQVHDPERFGVVEFDEEKKVISIEEKPEVPKSNYAVTGLYVYDNSVVEKAKSIKPSDRGEIEITDINKLYLKESNLNVELLGRGFAWLDTGTFESLLDAGKFVEMIEKRQGLKIACLEEIAYLNNWISLDDVKSKSEVLKKNSYGEYLLKIYEREASK